MLGLTYNGRGKYTVPDFPEDTRELVIPAEGEAMTWTPIWTKAITESEYNSAFIDRAQKLLVNAEEHLPVEQVRRLWSLQRWNRTHLQVPQQVFLALSASERRIAVIRYFQTLADSYKNQKDPERKAKKATRQFNHTKYRRRDRVSQHDPIQGQSSCLPLPWPGCTRLVSSSSSRRRVAITASEKADGRGLWGCSSDQGLVAGRNS